MAHSISSLVLFHISWVHWYSFSEYFFFLFSNVSEELGDSSPVIDSDMISLSGIQTWQKEYFTFKIIIFKGWLRGSRRSRRDMRSTACKPSIILWRRPPRKTLLTVAVKGMGQGCHCEWCVLLLFVWAQNGLIAQSIGQGKSEDKSELKKGQLSICTDWLLDPLTSSDRWHWILFTTCHNKLERCVSLRDNNMTSGWSWMMRVVLAEHYWCNYPRPAYSFNCWTVNDQGLRSLTNLTANLIGSTRMTLDDYRTDERATQEKKGATHRGR